MHLCFFLKITFKYDELLILLLTVLFIIFLQHMILPLFIKPYVRFIFYFCSNSDFQQLISKLQEVDFQEIKLDIFCVYIIF